MDFDVFFEIMALEIAGPMLLGFLWLLVCLIELAIMGERYAQDESEILPFARRKKPTGVQKKRVA